METVFKYCVEHFSYVIHMHLPVQFCDFLLVVDLNTKNDLTVLILWVTKTLSYWAGRWGKAL